MNENSVVSLRQKDGIDDPLTEILRAGARKLIVQAVEIEFDTFLALNARLVLPDGRQRVVRHGHDPVRTIQTGIGPVEVQKPKARDRAAPAAGERIRFEVCATACSADQAPCAAVGEARVCVMFLRSKIRRKDGKEHRAWSVVENRRVDDGRVVQRQVLYLGEINDSQRVAWSKAIEVFDEGAGQSKQIALF